MKSLLTKAVDHLRYPSTYQGLIALALAAGVHVAPDLAAALTSAGVGVFGLIALLFSDADVKKKKK